MSRLILVTGATGRQGTALIDALCPQTPTSSDSSEQHSFHILALTRQSQSPAAKQLALKEHVTVVEGNLDDEVSVRKVFENARPRGGVWGVFCILAFPGLGANADGEEKQGKMLADLALEFGVSSYVFSSAERGGESHDDHAVLDRLAKVKVERHVRELGNKGLPWTILRPGFFMENYEGFLGAITVSVLKSGLKPDTTVKLIAVDDIGQVAAKVFQSPEAFASQILSVVGDVLTMAEQEVAYKEATGRAWSSIPGYLAHILIYMNGHTQGLLADLERVYLTRNTSSGIESTAQMSAAREAYSGMTSFKEWAAKQGQGKKGKRKSNWNQVSVRRLIMGRL